MSNWSGQQGTAANPSQPPPNMQRYYGNGPAAAQAPGAPTYASRSSPPMVSRPPSVTSVNSASSYHSATQSAAAPGPAPVNRHTQQQGHGIEQGGPPPRMAPHGSHPPPPHNFHNGIHSIPSGGGRYPLPPRNGMVQPVRPIPRGPMPPRQHHGMHQHQGGPMGHHYRPGVGSGQQMRPALNEYNQSGGHSHSHFAAKPPSSNYNSMLGRPGGGQQHAPMHHNIPYRQMHSMPPGGGGGGPHGYHHQGPHRQGPHHPNTYSHHVNHHAGPMGPQHTDQKYHLYDSRSSVGSPSVDNQSIGTRMSPSPPPAPPSCSGGGQGGMNNHPSALYHPPGAGAEFASTTDGSSVTNPLRERQNVQQGDQSNTVPPLGKALTGLTLQQKPANEDLTADAASILLQLSSVVTKDDGENESLKNDENARNQENNQPPPPSRFLGATTTTDGNISESNTMKPPSKGAAAPVATVEGESHAHDDVSTIAPSEAPDLTSEPSSDSVEQHQPVVESEFPAPIPDNYPTRLALPYDDSKLNSLHCFLRSELLEIFVVQKSLNKSPTHSPGSSVGRVGLRCVHCALKKRAKDDRDEAPMAVFYPKSIAEIYRLVTSWQRCHLRKCRNLPPAVRSKWQMLRDNDKSRGKTHYWITSAKEIGLIDCQSRAGGIRFGPNTKSCVQPPATTDGSKEAPMDVSNSAGGGEEGQNVASSMCTSEAVCGGTTGNPATATVTAV